MVYILIILQALLLATPITCKIIQISPDYERYAPGSSYIINVPVTKDLITVPGSRDLVNVPTPGTPRDCQDQLIGIPSNSQWSSYGNNLQDKVISNEINNIVKSSLPYNNEFIGRRRKGLGSTLENIKTQLANLAQFALASYNLIENADSAKMLANRDEIKGELKDKYCSKSCKYNNFKSAKSTACYSKNINHKENKTKSIQITIPITSAGIGVIRVDEIRPEDEYCIEPNVNIISIDNEPETEERAEPTEYTSSKPTEGTLPEPIKNSLPKVVESTLPKPYYENNNKRDDTAAVATEEQTFEGPVRASGTINILGNFGPTIAGDPFIYPMYRPVPLYPIYPVLNDPNSSESSEQPDDQKDPGTVNGGPYPFYRPVPLYPIFPSVLRESACSEESESIDPVIPYGQPSPYPMYRPPFFPVRPPFSNDLNQTDDPAKSKEPLTLNDDTRRLLRNLMLLNVAHQSSIPCEVVPIPPTTRTSPEDDTEPTCIE